MLLLLFLLSLILVLVLVVLVVVLARCRCLAAHELPPAAASEIPRGHAAGRGAARSGSKVRGAMMPGPLLRSTERVG